MPPAETPAKIFRLWCALFCVFFWFSSWDFYHERFPFSVHPKPTAKPASPSQRGSIAEYVRGKLNSWLGSSKTKGSTIVTAPAIRPTTSSGHLSSPGDKSDATSGTGQKLLPPSNSDGSGGEAEGYPAIDLSILGTRGNGNGLPSSSTSSDSGGKTTDQPLTLRVFSLGEYELDQSGHVSVRPYMRLNLHSWRQHLTVLHPTTKRVLIEPRIILLNNQNLKKYIPDAPEEYFRLPYSAAKSDAVRYAVLFHLGGIYMDTDILMQRDVHPRILFSLLLPFLPVDLKPGTAALKDEKGDYTESEALIEHHDVQRRFQEYAQAVRALTAVQQQDPNAKALGEAGPRLPAAVRNMSASALQPVELFSYEGDGQQCIRGSYSSNFLGSSRGSVYMHEVWARQKKALTKHCETQAEMKLEKICCLDDKSQVCHIPWTQLGEGISHKVGLFSNERESEGGRVVGMKDRNGAEAGGNNKFDLKSRLTTYLDDTSSSRAVASAANPVTAGGAAPGGSGAGTAINSGASTPRRGRSLAGEEIELASSSLLDDSDEETSSRRGPDITERTFKRALTDETKKSKPKEKDEDAPIVFKDFRADAPVSSAGMHEILVPAKRQTAVAICYAFVENFVPIPPETFYLPLTEARKQKIGRLKPNKPLGRTAYHMFNSIANHAGKRCTQLLDETKVTGLLYKQALPEFEDRQRVVACRNTTGKGWLWH
eukprot:g7542.t1